MRMHGFNHVFRTTYQLCSTVDGDRNALSSYALYSASGVDTKCKRKYVTLPGVGRPQ